MIKLFILICSYATKPIGHCNKTDHLLMGYSSCRMFVRNLLTVSLINDQNDINSSFFYCTTQYENLFNIFSYLVLER